MELTEQAKLDYEIPKLKSRDAIVASIKRTYQNHLDKIVDIGVSSITIEEAIDELAKHLNYDNSINVNDSTKPFALVIADLVHHANHNYNLIVIDKIKIRSRGIPSFSIEDIAVSINPKFSLENMYVRFFIEYLENSLKLCLDDNEMDDLIEKILNKINKKCTNVILQINNLQVKYKNEMAIFNDINREFNKPSKRGGRL